MSITPEQIERLGTTGKVLSRSGGKIGSIGQLYLDDSTGDPAWVTVKTGFFGSAESFVPLHDAEVRGRDVVVGFDEDKVKGAPRVDDDGSISPEEEDKLYAYYGLAGLNADTSDVNASPDTRDVDAQDVDGHFVNTTDAGPQASNSARYGGDVPSDADDPSEAGNDRPETSQTTVGHDRSGPTTDDAMTRSEERLNVGTATREAGRARLRKYVTTETVTQTVPMRHEEVTLEREPITADNADAAQSGPAISEEEHEVVLHEEVPVVEKEAVAVERVKLGKETVTGQATVSDEVRKENIELTDPADSRTSTGR